MKDEYAWLEDIEDPRVVKWALTQDHVCRTSVREYSAGLFRRLVPFYKLPIMRSIQLTKRGIILFFSDHKSYKVQLLHDDGEKEPVADSAKLGKDTVIQAVQAREDGRVLALHYSQGGSDEGTVKILDLETSKEVDSLQGFIGDILWLKHGYYYVRTSRNEKTPDGVEPPADRVFRRAGEEEEMCFGKGLPTNTFIEMTASRDNSQALLNAYHGFTTCRPYAGPVDQPTSWTSVYPETGSVVSNIDYVNGKHLLLSFEKSSGEVLSITGKTTHRIVTESEWPLQEAAMVNDGILCHYLVDACSELHLYGVDGRLKKRIKFELPGSLIGAHAISALGGEAAIAFSSFTLPFRIYKVKGGRLKMLLAEELPGRHSVKHGYATSADGTRIHYFLTSQKDASPRKVLLFGYGGFRISPTPSFNPVYLPFLEDGGVFAVANLRGGLEHGEDWHKAGMRENKFRVFEDYLAVLAKLKSEGADVVGYGRSNGGLLMGATMNSRPELFAGVLIGYPVLDMMSYHKMLIGRAWVPEYGDPEDPKDREFLLKYSPYHNIAAGESYPPVFIYSGLKDDRVHPAHAFKFYAKLKDAGADVALRVEAESGHIGTTPEARVREEADKLAFVYKTLKMTPQA